jgi:hypothetical protein
MKSLGSTYANAIVHKSRTENEYLTRCGFYKSSSQGSCCRCDMYYLDKSKQWRYLLKAGKVTQTIIMLPPCRTVCRGLQKMSAP